MKDGKKKFYVGFAMRKYNKWAALFGGWFGLHRYLSGEIGMGILYTLTCGGFCIGWIRDICVSFSSRSDAWSQWSDVCGEAAEARKRRALNGELTPVHIDLKAKTGTFAGSEGGQYHTTLSGCTCPDFQKRKVPCKHMYYLAIKCNIEI